MASLGSVGGVVAGPAAGCRSMRQAGQGSGPNPAGLGPNRAGWERRVPTLQFYVPDDVADALRARAEERGANLSNYLSEIVVRHLRRDWPDAWVDTAAAAWDDEWRPPEGPVAGEVDES